MCHFPHVRKGSFNHDRRSWQREGSFDKKASGETLFQQNSNVYFSTGVNRVMGVTLLCYISLHASWVVKKIINMEVSIQMTDHLVKSWAIKPWWLGSHLIIKLEVELINGETNRWKIQIFMPFMPVIHWKVQLVLLHWVCKSHQMIMCSRYGGTTPRHHWTHEQDKEHNASLEDSKVCC